MQHEHDIQALTIEGLEEQLADAKAALAWAIYWVSPPVADDYETQDEFDAEYEQWEEAYLKHTGLIYPRRPDGTLGK